MTTLPQGKLAETVIETFERSGIPLSEINPDTPMGLMIRLAKWDNLLNPVELTAIKMVIRRLNPLQVEL